MTLAIETHGLTKHYGSVEALRGIDLRVPAGAVLGLVGPNGAGKTTAFAILCGYVWPTAGTATVLGVPAGEAHALRGRLASLPQDSLLAPNVRVLDHLVHLSRLSGRTGLEARAEAEWALGLFGLADRARSRAGTLSHGMLKRVALAQAMLGNPEVLLLDEPTSGLDPRSVAELRDTMTAYAAGRLPGRPEVPRTLVISSHVLAEIEAACTHLCIIDHGRIVEQGELASLTKRDAEVVVQVAEGYRPPADLGTRIGALSMDHSPATHEIRFKFDPQRTTADAFSNEAVQALIASGASIRKVDRGRSLEERYLELTRPGAGA